MEIAETLEALCKAEGVSGAESAACKAALDILKKYTMKFSDSLLLDFDQVYLFSGSDSL